MFYNRKHNGQHIWFVLTWNVVCPTRHIWSWPDLHSALPNLSSFTGVWCFGMLALMLWAATKNSHHVDHWQLSLKFNPAMFMRLQLNVVTMPEFSLNAIVVLCILTTGDYGVVYISQIPAHHGTKGCVHTGAHPVLFWAWTLFCRCNLFLDYAPSAKIRFRVCFRSYDKKVKIAMTLQSSKSFVTKHNYPYNWLQSPQASFWLEDSYPLACIFAPLYIIFWCLEQVKTMF